MSGSVGFDSFLAGAQKFAALAMNARARSDHELFALHAGVSVEHLAKAALACSNPALLLDLSRGRRSTEMLYHLTGVKSVGPERTWTIGAAEAISRLRDLGVLPSCEMLDRLIELRNGVAHSTGENMTGDLLPIFVQTAGTLLGHVDADPQEFWGPWRRVVVAISEGQGDFTQDINLRIQHARQLYIERASIQADQTMAVCQDGYLEGEGWRIWGNEDRVTVAKMLRCPACEELARAQVTVLLRDVTDDHAIYKIDQLLCSHCRLKLTGRAEIEAAGLEWAMDVNLNQPSAWLAVALRFYLKHPDYFTRKPELH